MFCCISVFNSVFSQQSTSGPFRPANVPSGIIKEKRAFEATGTKTITGVPSYNWLRGCGPTATGMVIGYYDLNGFPDLIPGDASSMTADVNNAIANDLHYNDYSLPIDVTPTLLKDKSELGGAHTSNCIADFMRTSWSSAGNYYGWSYATDVSPAFTSYVGHMNTKYLVTNTYVLWSNSDKWNLYKNEIDNNRPVVLLVDSDGNGTTDHFVTGIGYDDTNSLYGIYDTWDNNIHWYSWTGISSGVTWGIYGFNIFHIENHTGTVTTTAVSGTAQTTAISGGNISSDGGTAITARGVCWSTRSTPTVALTTKTTNGSGTGSFISNISGLATGTLYYVRAYATNSSGTVYGNEVSFTTLATPSTPVSSAATNITQTGFSANWNASSGATGYYLDVSTSSTFVSFVTGYSNKSVGNVLSSSVSGLTAGTTYYYRVRAFNSAGTSVSSNIITAKTLTVSIPVAPVATTATNITQTGFSANWNASSGATGYYLDVSTSSTFASFVTGYSSKSVGNVLSSSVSGLTVGTTYYYRVRAFNSTGTSVSSNIITAKTLTVSIPVAPVATTATNITQTGFSANWNASSSATGYYLDVSISSTFASFVTGYSSKSVGNVLSSSVSGLTAGTIYYYRVRAYNSSGTSPNSSTILVQLPSVLSVNLTPYQPAGWDNKIVLSTTTGTNTSSSVIYDNQSIYLDWAVINNGTSNITATFYTSLYVDGVLKITWNTPGLVSSYYAYVYDYNVGTLSSGTHTFRIVNDATSLISETSETDNEYTRTFTVTTYPSSSVNLTPYQPSGWDNKIVLSTSTGTNSSSTTIYSNQNVYLDWAVINNGTSNITSTFYSYLYVDGTLVSSWYTSGLLANNYAYLNDYNLGILAAGTHTFRILNDATGIVAETSELDNEYTRTFTITPISATNFNLTPYQPTGFDNKLVLSTVTGTNVSASTIYSNQAIYLDWAVINNGTSNITGTFYSYLYIDGTLISSWYTSGLAASNYAFVSDASIGALAAGTHTFRIVTDATSVISETSETDNEFSRTITIVGATGSGVLSGQGSVLNSRVIYPTNNSSDVPGFANAINGLSTSISSGSVSGFSDKNSLNEILLAKQTKTSSSLSEEKVGPIIILNAYPNPGSGNITLSCMVTGVGQTTLTVYNLQGKVINVIFKGHIDEGKHEFKWNCIDISGKPIRSGIYICRLESGNNIGTIKLIINHE